MGAPRADSFSRNVKGAARPADPCEGRQKDLLRRWNLNEIMNGSRIVELGAVGGRNLQRLKHLTMKVIVTAIEIVEYIYDLGAPAALQHGGAQATGTGMAPTDRASSTKPSLGSRGRRGLELPLSSTARNCRGRRPRLRRRHAA